MVSQKCSVNALNTSDENVLEDQKGTVKGFGFSVWRLPKKTYVVSFNNAVNLLGVGSAKAKEWVLAANAADFTMLRNHLAYTVAATVLDKIPYVTGSAFAQLYINGEYSGVYQVVERVQFDAARLDYKFEPGVNDTNYLVRLDFEADVQIDSDAATNYFAISNKKYYIENKGMTQSQLSYVSAAYNSMMSAIGTGNQNQVESIVDIDSLVDTYILHEYFKNSDVGYSGLYTVKEKGGKIVFTAPFDFYRSAGNDESIANYSPEALFPGDGVTKYDGSNPIFYRLMRRKWFVDKVIARWNEVKAELSKVPSMIDEFDAQFGADMEENAKAWGDIIGTKNDRQPPEVLELETYDANVKYLKDWFEARYTWLDKFMNSSSVYSQLK